MAVSEDAGSVTLAIADREWRARGVENNASFDLLKVNLRLLHNERFHLDTLDLYQARQRQAFVRQAAEETGLEQELVQRDLAKVLLELEGVRDRRLLGVLQPAEPVPAMTSEEREEALTWLKAPNLIGGVCAKRSTRSASSARKTPRWCRIWPASRAIGGPLAIIVQMRQRRRQDDAHGCGARVLPGGGAHQILGDDRPILYYLGETNLKHKILAIVEEAGAERASYALKFFQSEGE